MVLVLARPADFELHVGAPLGPGEWHTVDQTLIDDFARVTGDHTWVHVDRNRAAAEMPGGVTIGHGLLTLALVPQMLGKLYSIDAERRAYTYGYDTVRFVSPVPAGARLRLRGTVSRADRDARGLLVRLALVVEIEGQERPAMATEMIEIFFDR